MPYFRGAPNFYQMLKTDEQRQIADLFFGQSEIARPLIGPPGMPAPIVAALRKAMAEAVKDKAFLADAAKLGSISIRCRARRPRSRSRFYRTPPAVVARAVAIMGEVRSPYLTAP